MLQLLYMSPWTVGFTLLLVMSAGTAAAQSTEKKTTYRWVDDKGVVHYGDHVPPEYSQQESSVLNKEGVQIGKLEARKTPEELAADERRQQAALKQKQHDSFLMTTYASVTDIERLRDERLATLEEQRKAAQLFVDNLHSRLSLLQARALLFKPYNPRPEARRMPDDIAEELVRLLNDMRTQNDVLTGKDEEGVTLRQQFQADISRYKELRGSPR
jgi:hypothetical protein